MILITKKPNIHDEIRQRLQVKGLKCSCHKVTIDTEGLLLTINGDHVEIPCWENEKSRGTSEDSTPLFAQAV